MASGQSIADESVRRKMEFLEAYRFCGTAEEAAITIGVARQTITHWKTIDEVFAEEVQLIRDRHSVDRLVVAMEATQ